MNQHSNRTTQPGQVRRRAAERVTRLRSGGGNETDPATTEGFATRLSELRSDKVAGNVTSYALRIFICP
jgi:hypothetical protein